MAKKMNKMMPMPMMEYEYSGYMRNDFINAAKSASMLNEEMYVGMDGDDHMREHLLKDFTKTIEYVEGQNDIVSASILRDEMARYM